MCRRMFFAGVCALFVLSFRPGIANCQEPVSVTVEPHSNGRLVVPVMLNGKGPFSFLVDTGASMTIVDSALFQQLGIKTQGYLDLASISNENRQRLGIVDEVSVNGLRVSPVSVLAVDDLDIGPIHVRGVLGENFLSHFDLLIDNQHRRISLDAGDSLADQMVGERLPVTFDSAMIAQGMKARPTVAVTLAAYGRAPLNLLLDSGADTVTVRAPKDRHRTTSVNQSERSVTMHSVYGTVACESWEDELRWGKYRANGVRMTDCGSKASTLLGDEGSLPTSAFKQILVSHSGAYVVLNPTRRLPVPEVSARVERPEDAVVEGTE